MKHSTLSLAPIRTHGKFADAAYEAIRTGIRMGRIPPGTRLHEADLADQLGISTPPVREALGGASFYHRGEQMAQLLDRCTDN